MSYLNLAQYMSQAQLQLSPQIQNANKKPSPKSRDELANPEKQGAA
jgi:hypothetical protein